MLLPITIISNKAVLEQLQAFSKVLREELAINEVYIALWKPEFGKGLDDVLAEKIKPSLRKMV